MTGGGKREPVIRFIDSLNERAARDFRSRSRGFQQRDTAAKSRAQSARRIQVARHADERFGMVDGVGADEAHLARMCAFWSSVALMTGRYSGQPMRMHMPLPVDARHFDRWLALFEATARELCPAVAADHFIERARRIAESLELGIAGARGVMLAKGQRYLAGETPG